MNITLEGIEMTVKETVRGVDVYREVPRPFWVSEGAHIIPKRDGSLVIDYPANRIKVKAEPD